MVKVLFSSSHSTLGQELSEWLAEVNDSVRLINVSMDSNEYGHCLAVLYEQGPGPNYRTHLVFHSRHSGVEEEANQALSASAAGRPALIAVGSNKFGHALCIIEEA